MAILKIGLPTLRPKKKSWVFLKIFRSSKVKIDLDL